MRITSGVYKGVNIKLPKLTSIRPTSEKTRMALFNYLDDLIVNKTMLDIFSGSGAVGIEALSRQAISVDFIEKDRQLCNLIQSTLLRINEHNSCNVLQGDAISLLKKLDLKYDIIFADPPYDYANKEEILSTIETFELLNSHGMVILEHRSNQKINENVLNFQMYDSRIYGDTQISFYKKV